MSVTIRALSSFNCRYLGVTGTFLRSDYSVDCHSDVYTTSLYFSAISTVLIPVGIPLLFTLIIKNKSHPYLLVPSRLLYENFELEWEYFDVYDLIRKLMLTSLATFVSHPDSATRCLFLLCVDGTALVVLAYSRPYVHENDDFLSSSFVTVECIAFLVALVMLSNINTDDGWGSLAILNLLFVVTIVALFVFVPCSLAMKFRAINSRVHGALDKVSHTFANAGLQLPDLKRLSSKYRISKEIRLSMDSVDGNVTSG